MDRVEGNGAEKPVWREVAREFLSGYLAAEAALSLIYDVVPLLQRDVDSYEQPPAGPKINVIYCSYRFVNGNERDADTTISYGGL